MTGAAESLALTLDGQTFPIECLDRDTEQQLLAQLKQGVAPKVSLVAAPSDGSDVEGHTFASLRSVLVHLNTGGGQPTAARVQFPVAEDAERFRRALLAAGLVAGTIVVGSLTGIAAQSATSAATAGSSGDTTQVVEGWSGSVAQAPTLSQVTDSWPAGVPRPSTDKLVAGLSDVPMASAAQAPATSAVTDNWPAGVPRPSSDKLTAGLSDGGPGSVAQSPTDSWPAGVPRPSSDKLAAGLSDGGSGSTTQAAGEDAAK